MREGRCDGSRARGLTAVISVTADAVDGGILDAGRVGGDAEVTPTSSNPELKADDHGRDRMGGPCGGTATRVLSARRGRRVCLVGSRHGGDGAHRVPHGTKGP